MAFWFANFTLHATANQTQTFNLDPGWNLITFQLSPSNSAPAAVFSPLGNDFRATWSFDNETRQWTRYARPGTPESTNNQIAAMGSVQIGRAYWVYMDAARNWVVTGAQPTTVPPLVFTNGWNLIGIPLGAATVDEPISMLSVLAVSGMDYDMILRWEAGVYDKFTPDDQDVDDFTTFDATRGYWVRLTTNRFVLQPKLLSSVRADTDVEPQGNYPSYEDLKLSDSMTPLGPTNQTHIVFLSGEDTYQLAIANLGGGILLWDIQWEPQDAVTAGWLEFSATKGITTIENDVINIYLNRTHLTPGTYHGALRLRTTAGNRDFQVIANVPSLGGEWRGSATIKTVNNRHNPVPDVDLHVDFYEDPSTAGLIRGLIDSRNALLWPVDVPLIGHFLSEDGSVFSLGGAYVLSPGDQNNPPYDIFNGGTNGVDADWDDDGNMDAVNMLPFPIYRSVTLIGRVKTAAPNQGYVLEGSYIEMVEGMLKQPIRLEGAFTLRRENVLPFANRPKVANAESADGTQPVVLRSYAPASPLSIPTGTLTNTLTYVTDMVLQGITVGVDIGDVSADQVKLTLLTPEGTNAVLHDRASLTSLRNMSFPGLRKPKDSFSALLAAGVRSKGPWRLVIQNFGATTGKLYSWSLQLQGQPVFDVYGTVIDPISDLGLGAQVLVDGLPISAVALADSNGRFVFSRLPGIPVNFTANLLGYSPQDMANPGLSSGFTTPSYSSNNPTERRLALRFRPMPGVPVPSGAISGFSNFGQQTNPVVLTLAPRTDLGPNLQVLAAPPFGFAPLSVLLTLTGPSNQVPAGSTVVWTFGDGTATNGVNLRSLTHTYTQIRTNGYVVSAQVGSSSAFCQVISLPSPGSTPNTLNFFQAHFTAAGTIPANFVVGGSNNVSQPPPWADLIMVQQADCASFDMDHAPSTTSANRNYSQDGFAASNSADTVNGFKGEDYNYSATEAQWEDAATYAYSINDDLYDPWPKTAERTAGAPPRFQMTCNISPVILPPPNAEVMAVPTNGPPSVFYPETPDPLLDVVRRQIAHIRGMQLIIGPLAEYWKGGAQ